MPTVSRDAVAAPARLPLRVLAERRRRPAARDDYASDPARNGEPFGEIGLVDHEDAAWGDQHGGPRDPQPGHEHGHRDIHRTDNVLPIGSGPDMTPSQISTPPPPPVILDPTMTFAALVGLSGMTAFLLQFTGGAGATLDWTITDSLGHTVSGETTIAGDGHASVNVNLASLVDGLLTVTAVETDAAENTETYAPQTFTKDTTPPAAPTVTIAGGIWTVNTTTPGLTVNGEAGSTGRLYVNGVLYTVGTPLVNGTYSVTATSTDAAGNTSAPSATSTLTIATASTLAATATLNAGAALTSSHTVSLTLNITHSAAISNIAISINGGPATNYGATAPAMLTVGGPDGVYSILVTITDAASNTAQATASITLDTTGPTITSSLSASYDVGAPITLTWTAADANGVSSSSAAIESQTISASGGTINTSLLAAGNHTVTITAIDAAGNLTTKSITFAIHPSAQGLLNALNAATTAQISASFKSSLVSQMNKVVSQLGKGNSAHTALNGFISMVQGGTVPSQITAAYKALLLSWANDLLPRI